MSRSLTVVSDRDIKPAVLSKETVAQRVRRLQAEARNLANDHVASMTAAMFDLSAMAAEIADGGDAYAPGIRDMARVLAEDLESRAQTVEAIRARR